MACTAPLVEAAVRRWTPLGIGVARGAVGGQVPHPLPPTFPDPPLPFLPSPGMARLRPLRHLRPGTPHLSAANRAVLPGEEALRAAKGREGGGPVAPVHRELSTPAPVTRTAAAEATRNLAPTAPMRVVPPHAEPSEGPCHPTAGTEATACGASVAEAAPGAWWGDQHLRLTCRYSKGVTRSGQSPFFSFLGMVGAMPPTVPNKVNGESTRVGLP